MAATACKWPSDVEEILQKTKQDVADGGVSMRVPEAMVNSKAEAYNPQLVSLGPYHHLWSKDKPLEPSNQRPTRLSQMEVQKLKKATEKDPELIKRLFTEVSKDGMISEFEQVYHQKIEEEDIPEFAWMMMVDALFLCNFLLATDTNSKIIMPEKESIICDIMKLENQIPLSLLLKVESSLNTSRQAVENAPQGRTASVMESHIKSLCCFQVPDINFDVEKEKHLLDHMHTLVSSVLQVEAQDGKQVETQDEKQTRHWVLSGIENMFAGMLYVLTLGRNPARQGQHDFLRKYNAKELANGGIKFKSFQMEGKIRFCKNFDTLYLPQITISDTYTEVLLRNLLALEFNDASPEKRVMHYVELMDCLIDTHEDVDLLRKSDVIVRKSISMTDDHVAKMWDGMSKPVDLPAFMGLSEDLKAQIKEALIKNYYNIKIRRWWDEFRGDYLSSPWKVTALVVGIFVLILTMVQTYCSVKECEPEHREEKGSHRRFNR